MATWIRARDTSGHEISVRGDVSEGHPRGLRPGMEQVEKPATRRGDPLPPKYRTPMGTPRPGSAVERRRAKKKTSGTKPAPTAALQPEPKDGHEADTQTEE